MIFGRACKADLHLKALRTIIFLKKGKSMPKFRVVFREVYLHAIEVDANSYLEAEEKADILISKDLKEYREKDPSWYLEGVSKIDPEKIPRKDFFLVA